MNRKAASPVLIKVTHRFKITISVWVYILISISFLFSGCEFKQSQLADQSEYSDKSDPTTVLIEKQEVENEQNMLSDSKTSEASTMPQSSSLPKDEITTVPKESETTNSNQELSTESENRSDEVASVEESTKNLDSPVSESQTDISTSTPSDQDILEQNITLSINSSEIRQGDLVAVWVKGIPSNLNQDKSVMIQASWLKNPIKAELWRDYYVALLQATVSVNPNTYSVRAFYKTTATEGSDGLIEEIDSTKTLVKIVQRQFEQQIFSVSKELEEKRSDENINNDAEKVAKAKSDGSTVPIWHGAFTMPIPNQLAKSFGKQRIINGKLNYTHSGVDISGSTGTHILAPAAGRVVFSGELVVAGNTVILDHGLGMYSSLVHMSKTGVDVGQFVQPGDLVGYVGETGFATGPHLHWTLTVHGNIVDPEYLIAKDPLEEIR